MGSLKKQKLLEYVTFKHKLPNEQGECLVVAEFKINATSSYPADIDVPDKIIKRALHGELFNYIHSSLYGEILDKTKMLKQLMRSAELDPCVREESEKLLKELEESTYMPEYCAVIEPHATVSIELQ